MSPVPSIQVPDIPASTSIFSSTATFTPKAPKSMLRNLFAWKRTSSSQETDVAAVTIADIRPQTSSSTQQPPPTMSRKPSFSQRSRSDTSVPQRSKTRSKSRRRSRSRCRAIWDPPPLFKANREACLHDTLQVPKAGFLDWLPRNGSNRSSARNLDTTEDDKEDFEAPSIHHRRSMSDSSSSSLSKKLSFLFENGHLLQYKAEGSHDRLPERALELSRDSLAFASDAIVGQHWVLEIWPDGRPDDDTKSVASKSTWSRMTLKSPDMKKLTERLLMVFESPDVFDSWLFAIRKQIEGLGGLEYQPDAPPLPQPDSKRPTLKHASSEYFKRKSGTTLFSRSSAALPAKVDDAVVHEKDLPDLPPNLTHQSSVSARSTTASSVATTSSLDRLRESYSGSSTAGTTLSSNVSATSLSPTREGFFPSLSPILVRELKTRPNLDRSIPRTPTSPLFNSEERSPSPETVSVRNSHKLLSPPIKQSDEADDRSSPEVRTALRLIPEVVVGGDRAASPSDRPAPILQPLPIPALRKKLRQAQRNLPASDKVIESDDRTKETQGRQHHSRPSFPSTTKGSYGLFPKKMAVNVKSEPLVIPDRNNVPGLLHTQATNHVDISASPITPVASQFGADLFARSKTTFKRPVPIALPQRLLAPIEIDQPMRSPAVTDAMLDSNFGIMPSGATTQPATPVEIRVPDFGDLKVDRSLFESVRDMEVQKTSPSASPKSRGLTPRRSLPNFHYGSANAVCAPAGPPPSVPLPAVPPTNEGRNSRTSTPSKRGSTQNSSNRRASTKSATSVKKARSPAPSLSLPPAHTHSSMTYGARIPTSADAPPDTGSSAPAQPPETEAVSTIGQVSVSKPPAPPRGSSMSNHKKSLSTSSAKSGRSRKTHTRTPSGRSIHGSIPKIPAISYMIPPPCGLEQDFDYGEKRFFGMGTSRSST